MRLTDAEWIVMRAVWKDAPATARSVMERAEATAGWAYTTVKTMLDRLVEKGALEARRDGAATLYVPRLTEEEARRHAADDLAESAFGGSVGAMVHWLLGRERLSRRERDDLRALLEEHRRRGKA
jgi:predicted transcriptional regulator